ncbi:Bacterial type II and III secretion system protein [Candidatus Methanoperedenaceae archaeon GB37]|nr:Bacterial type II and III secretion system protein [Candidatus Methanoperedenaceae archaeon GB37]
MAKDGQTVVIGGLIQTKIEKTRSGVPILMDIPILRHLFSSNTYKKDKTEVLISITPHVIKRGKTAVQVSEAFLDKVKGLKKLLEKNKAEYSKE